MAGRWRRLAPSVRCSLRSAVAARATPHLRLDGPFAAPTIECLLRRVGCAEASAPMACVDANPTSIHEWIAQLSPCGHGADRLSANIDCAVGLLRAGIKRRAG